MQKGFKGRAMKTTIRNFRTLLATLLATFALIIGAESVQAQTVGANVTVPIAKVVPNACSGGFALINGNLNVGVSTATDPVSGFFTVTLTLTSSGQGQDASSDGTLLLNGSSLYQYAGSLSFDAGFPTVPASIALTLPMRDYLIRASGDTSDMMALTTTLEIDLTYGMLSGASLQQLDTRCQ